MAHELTDFTKEVLEESNSIPVVVDFWAPWCEPCLMLEPILDELAVEYSGHWKLVKINIDEHVELGRQYHIMSVPSTKIFYKGDIIGSYNGLMWKNDFARWIEQHMPDEDTDS
jgi:putative thioredoxin